MKRITILTPCYNEEENVKPLHAAVRKVFADLPDYEFEHLFIDNHSEDGTVAALRQLAAEYPNVKVILNTRNFGHVRSPYHGLLQATGDAVIALMADFQDPPEMIPKYLAKWEEGYKVVLGVKTSSDESAVMYFCRTLYYKFLDRVADVDLIQHATGSGLYDQQVIKVLRQIDDPYPYVRGLVADIGFDVCTLEYHQAQRRRGISKNNFYSLYDVAMIGVTNHSKLPLRLAAMMGFVMSGVSLLIAIGYLIAKLLFWYHYPTGIAPVLIGVFFFASVQLFFIGVLGEYIGAIYTQVRNRPLVIEKERLNFDSVATQIRPEGKAAVPEVANDDIDDSHDTDGQVGVPSKVFDKNRQ